MVAALNKVSSESYSRHHPEQGLLYRTVETYWPIFLREQARVGKKLPPFIRDEFEKFLSCGIPEHGFIRTYCRDCMVSGIIPFSCKKRGFCPSCCARRMNDEAAHLVDNVFPNVVMRQWVLSFPYKLRFLMAHNSKLTNKILSVFIQVIGSDQKKRAKRLGVKGARPGSVTFIQRFGSALNLNIHLHSIFTDGVFYKSGDEYKFFLLPEPKKEELFLLATKIQSKVLKFVENFGFNNHDQLEFDESGLSDLTTISITQKAAFGEQAGKGIRRYGPRLVDDDLEDSDPYSARVEGFSLNARVKISGHDREKLEKLIRYMARGPIATERLTESFPNQLLYKMKTQWRDGTTHVSFSHLDFIARLVALIPPPKMNMVRYHGVFAPNFKDRKLIVPKQKVKIESSTLSPNTDPLREVKVRRERMRWADMLKRTFQIDVTVCSRCNGRMEQIAVIKDRVVAKAILESLKEITIFRPLNAINERGPPEARSGHHNEFDQRGW